VELTRRREFNQASPDESSYETRSRRSRPTICSTPPMERHGLRFRRRRRCTETKVSGRATKSKIATDHGHNCESQLEQPTIGLAVTPGQISTATTTKTKATGTSNTGENSNAKTPMSTVVILETRSIVNRQSLYEASNG